MQNIVQAVVALETRLSAPVELSLDQLRHVSGGLGPNDSWAIASAQGPNDSWITANKLGPNDSW